jgi:hypothetical protein
MVNYCVGCGEQHDHYNWKFKDYEDRYGHKKMGWFCSPFYRPSQAKEWVPDRIKEKEKVGGMTSEEIDVILPLEE